MDYYKLREKRTMTVEKMIKILHQNGTEISNEKAEKVLQLIYNLSNLSIGETIAQVKTNRKSCPKKSKKLKRM
jgi:hypothetical protein